MKNKRLFQVVINGICAVVWTLIAVHEIASRSVYDYSVIWLVAVVICAIIWIAAFVKSIRKYFYNKLVENSFPIIEVPLANVQEIDEAGILFSNYEGDSMNIPYYDSYKAWCREAAVRKSKPKYICDIKESDEGQKIVFYYESQIIFHVNSDDEELLTYFEERIRKNGYECCHRLCEAPCK